MINQQRDKFPKVSFVIFSQLEHSQRGMCLNGTLQHLFLYVSKVHLDKTLREPCVISLRKDRQKRLTLLNRDTAEKHEWHLVAGIQD